MVDVVPLLDSLHPLREPPPPESIVPYVAMAIAGVLIAVLVMVGAQVFLANRRRIRRAAVAELARSRMLPPPERLAAQALLLRRLARTSAGDTEARQQGADWLAALDRLFATTFFSQGEGRAYGTSLYSRGPEPDIERLDGALAGFFATLRR